MAYSYEGVLAHPSRKTQSPTQYIDRYGVPTETHPHGNAPIDLDCVKNREPLPVWPSVAADRRGWTISDCIKLS